SFTACSGAGVYGGPITNLPSAVGVGGAVSGGVGRSGVGGGPPRPRPAGGWAAGGWAAGDVAGGAACWAAIPPIERTIRVAPKTLRICIQPPRDAGVRATTF